MEVYFNELSATQASNDTEAKQWISNLLELCKFIKGLLESLENTFTLRTTDDFQVFQITNTHNFIEFLQDNYGLSDPELGVFLSILSNPNIEKTDPEIEKYEYSSISINGITDNKAMSGLGASYIKKTMSISLDSNTEWWDTCKVHFEIHFLDLENLTEIHSKNITTRHASKVQHIIDCHLDFLSDLFDWATYRPRFDAVNKENNLLPLINIYSLYLGEGQPKEVWGKFYADIHNSDEPERKAKILEIAKHIAKVQKWEEATPSLRSKNTSRTLYMIPNSDFIVSIDKQHGDFEICKNEKKPNHYGSVSFDGLRFKEAENDHSIDI